jgi:hypothetical protein
MLAERHLPDYRFEATGTSRDPVRPAKYVIHFEAVGSETPSAFGWQSFLTLGTATGNLSVAEDAQYLVERAFEFMEKASHLLPYSEMADRAGDALVKRVRGDLATKPLTRKITR